MLDALDVLGLKDTSEEHEEELRGEFADAVELVGTQIGEHLDGDTQRQLYALHTRTTRGAPPDKQPEGMHPEQYSAWREQSHLTASEAMSSYVALVAKHTARSVPSGDSLADLPEALRKQLEAAGIRQADLSPAVAEEGHADIFAAAREGASLDAFLPAKRDEVRLSCICTWAQ